MLVNSNSLLINAQKHNYAVPAYNINNLEWARFILEECNKDKSPVILAVSESAVNYFGGFNVVYNVVKYLIKDLNIDIPVVLHLDHGKSIQTCKSAIDAGFTSVMIDASNKSLEENIKETNEVINYAKNKEVSVEAEIGSLGDEDSQENLKPVYADFDDVSEFVLRTGVDSIASAIGNKHGIYKGEPDLNFDLLGAICKEVKIPIVLHGASGLDDNKIKTAIFCGVSKININTDIQYAWSKSVRGFLNYDSDVYDPRKIIKSGEKAIKDVVHRKNILFESINKSRAN